MTKRAYPWIRWSRFSTCLLRPFAGTSYDLRAWGKIVRLLGAVMDRRQLKGEPSFFTKRERGPKIKRRIGQLVAEQIPPSATVFVDVGTTFLEAERASKPGGPPARNGPPHAKGWGRKKVLESSEPKQCDGGRKTVAGYD